jgi:hypothetical protein
MANELQLIAPSGVNVYVVLRNPAGSPWNGTTFESYDQTHQPAYAVVLSEETGSGFYKGDFPPAVTTPGRYSVVAFKRLGSAPAHDDTIIGTGNIDWTGSGEAAVPTADDLISLAYAKTFLRAADDSNDTLIQSLITSASKAVVRYCKRAIKPADYIDYLDGNDSASILLPSYPVTELRTVTLNWFDSGTAESIAGTEYIVNANTGEIRLKPTSTASGWFAPGFQNVRVITQPALIQSPTISSLQRQWL